MKAADSEVYKRNHTWAGDDMLWFKKGCIAIEIVSIVIATLSIRFLETETKHFGHEAGFLAQTSVAFATLFLLPALGSLFSIVRRTLHWSWYRAVTRLVLPLFALVFIILLTLTDGW